MHHHLSSFWWGDKIGEFLFQGWTINSTGSLIGICLLLILFSIVYEAIKVHQAKIRALAARERQNSVNNTPPSETATLISSVAQRNSSSKKLFKLFKEALVFLFHNTLGYFLMLSVMVYNGYVFIAVIFGMALGYFLFGHISMKVNMENVRARTTTVICAPKCEQETNSTATLSSPPSDGHCSTSNSPSNDYHQDSPHKPTVLKKIQSISAEIVDEINQPTSQTCRL